MKALPTAKIREVPSGQKRNSSQKHKPPNSANSPQKTSPKKILFCSKKHGHPKKEPLLKTRNFLKKTLC